MKFNRNATRTALWAMLLLGIFAFSMSGLPAEAQAEDGDAATKLLPKIVIDEPIADVGVVVKGDSVSHEFVIHNEGKATLEILEVRPACGCTVVEFDKKIAPGTSGKLTSTLNTAGLRSGGGSKGITLFTNDPDHPRVVLTMQAKLLDYLIFNPGFARFTGLGKGYDPGVVTQIFYTPKFDGLEIKGVESPFPFMDVTYRPATKEELRPDGTDNQYVFTMTLDFDKAPVGPLTGKMVVHTNHPQQKTAWLPVSGFVRPLLAVTPPKAHYGDMEKPEAMTTNFLVKSFAPYPLKITKVEENLEGAEAVVTALEEGKSYNVKVTFDKDMPKGDFAGQLKIHTDSKDKPLVVVNLTGNRI